MAPAEPQPGGRIRILHVEDSADEAFLVRTALQRSGLSPEIHRVDTVPALEEAFRPGAWDIVLADFHLAGWDGFRALRIVRGLDREIPFIVVSGAIGEEQAVAMLRSGAQDYVMKDNLLRLAPAILRELEEAEVRRERTRALEQLRESEARHRLLAEVGAVLMESLDPERTLDRVARRLLPELADWCQIDFLGDDGEMRAIAAAHADPEKDARLRAALSFESISPDVAGRRWLDAPSLVPDVSEALCLELAGSPARAALLLELGFRSFISVPLSSRGVTLGVLVLAAGEHERALGESELRTAREVAVRISSSVDNARLYREVQDSVRARDEFIAIAAHELKTPLTPLRLGVSNLLHVTGDGATSVDVARVRARLERLGRVSERLVGLVEHLLDVSRITVGKLTLEGEPLDAAQLLTESVGILADEISRAGCTVVWTEPPESVQVVWDRRRVAIVVRSLISNAIKFGAGREIELAMSCTDVHVRFIVRDHGPGLREDQQRTIFERFARRAPVRSYGGFGLGLWVVREIVQEHGGRVSLASRLGEGTAITVELPRLLPARARPIDGRAQDGAQGPSVK